MNARNVLRRSPAETFAYTPVCIAYVLALAALLLWTGCREIDAVRDVLRPATPYERYTETLREAELDATALGRAWLAAGPEALRTPLEARLPLREIGYFDPARPAAVAYRFAARQGQEVRIALSASDSLRLFVDLFEVPGDTSAAPRHVAHADSAEAASPVALTVEVPRDQAYLLRVQPELLAGGRYELSVAAGASLQFPVSGVDSRVIRSFFGDARDGGARDHHGVDIFAPRGTPVVAAADGYVTRVRTGGLGGKTVWMRTSAGGASLYYAHLDSQIARPRTRVETGDTLGLVGNTGNARTTPPHLHFGIYRRGPVDPYPFVHEPLPAPASDPIEAERLGRWARVAVARANLRAGPTTETPVRRALPRHTALRLGGSTGTWRRVRLPDGASGYVAASLLRPAETPLRTLRLSEGRLLRHRPAPFAAATDSLAAGTQVEVLATAGRFSLVRTGGRAGWIALRS